jgi:hypothetical protein
MDPSSRPKSLLRAVVGVIAMLSGLMVIGIGFALRWAR